MPRAYREPLSGRLCTVSRGGGTLPGPWLGWQRWGAVSTGSFPDQATSQPCYWPRDQLSAAMGQARVLLAGGYLMLLPFAIQFGHHHTTFTIWTPQHIPGKNE